MMAEKKFPPGEIIKWCISESKPRAADAVNCHMIRQNKEDFSLGECLPGFVHQILWQSIIPSSKSVI